MMRKKAKSGTKVKKAQLGKLVKKGIQAVTKAAKPATKKKIPKIKNSLMKKAVKKTGRADLKAKMKKWDSEMKTPGKVTKSKSGTSVKKAGYGKMTKKAKMGCSTKRK